MNTKINKDLTDLGVAIELISSSKTSLKEHTWFLFGLAVFAILIVAPQQVHHAWDGDFVTVTDHDPFSYQINQVIRGFLNAFGKEHPAEKYHRDNPRKDESHPKHHSKLGNFVQSHWKTLFLQMLIFLNLCYLASSLIRLYAANAVLSYLSLLAVIWVVTMNCVAQFLSILLSFYLIVVDGSAWDYVAIFCASLFLMQEFIAFHDLLTIRRVTVAMSHTASSYLHELRKMNEEEKEMSARAAIDPLAVANEFLKMASFAFNRRRMRKHPKKTV